MYHNFYVKAESSVIRATLAIKYSENVVAREEKTVVKVNNCRRKALGEYLGLRVLTYLMVLFGFLYGLWEPSVDRVMSRKLIVCPFYSILMLSLFRLKIRWRAFSILVVSGPLASSM